MAHVYSLLSHSSSIDYRWIARLFIANQKKKTLFLEISLDRQRVEINGKRYLRFDVGDLLPIDQDIVEGVGRLDDQRQDRYERENQHLQQLNSTSAAVSRIRGTCPAGFLSVRLGRRDIVRRETPHRAHFRHARAITRWHAEIIPFSWIFFEDCLPAQRTLNPRLHLVVNDSNIRIFISIDIMVMVNMVNWLHTHT